MKIKFTPDFNTALAIAEKYSLETESIKKAVSEIPDFRVTAPVVGGFSTGKSTLINAVLGEKLLSTNITPETAVPTEITFGNDTATLVSVNGGEKIIPLYEFDSNVLSASDYSLVKIAASNAFLRDIPSIKLVDMPGFDSGIENHNRAIDNYLPQSLAYVVTVSADEGTLRASIINFLNELKLYSVPVYTVITKSTKATPEDVDKLKAHISETLTRFLKIDNPKIAVTSAKGNVDIDEFRSFLMELQRDSDDIFNKYFSGKLNYSCKNIEKYLCECLDKDDMTLESLTLQKEQAERAFDEVGKKFNSEKERFREQVEHCVSSIKSKIGLDLESSRNTIESLILQNQEGAVREKINSIIRTTYAYGIQTELEPRVKKYIANVENSILVNVYDASAELSEMEVQMDNQIKAVLNSSVQQMIPMIGGMIGTTIGSAAAAGGATAGTAAAGAATGSVIPVIGPIIGLAVGTIAGILINVGFNAKQKSEREKLAREKTSEIIESATKEASDKIATVVYQYVDKIDESLSVEIEKERALKARALSDCEEKLSLESDERKRKTAELTEDLETIRRIVDANR